MFVVVSTKLSYPIRTEWKFFRSYLSKQPKGTPYFQLTELTTKEMLITMFPNINTHANISLSIPVGTASVDVLRYFKCGSTMRNVSLDNLESSNGTLYAKSIPPEDGFYM